MPPRPLLPADDLYARLGVPHDASPEAIELAWRGLLRKHHPDVAGPDALDLAKRINVAHDWLSDAALRERYDRERGRARPSIRSGRRPREGAAAHEVVRPRPRRPPTTEERLAAVVERVTGLSTDELDRLSLADLAPIAFLATLRRFVTPDLQDALDEAERVAFAGLPPSARQDPATRDAISGQLADVVMGDVIEELLGDPAGQRARERLTRGWDAAVGQPRYGPASAAVAAYLEHLRRLDRAELRWLAATGSRELLGEPPWPDATSREEDEALRVSSELAARDAVTALDGAPAAARRAAARVAHLIVLRHAFARSAFERLAAPWLGRLIDTATPNTRVRPRR